MKNITKNPSSLSIKQKILIIVVSLVLFLAVTEIGLRLVGNFYLLIRRGKVELKSSFKILCLGDSFTYGVGAKHEESYPEQLERLLNENYKNKYFEVFNLGVPSFNSSQTLKYLEKNADKFNPDLIIVLTGLNNQSQLLDIEYPLVCGKEVKSRNILFSQRLVIFFNKFRVYKLLKTCIVNFKNKMATNDYREKGDENIDLIYGREELKRIIETHLNNVPLDNQKYEEPIKEFKELTQLNPSDFWAHFQLAWLYKMEGKDRLAIEEFVKAEKINSNDFWTCFQLGWLYRKQGQAKLAREQFDRISKIDQHNVLGEETQKGFTKTNYWRHFELGLSYKREGKYEHALREFQSSIEVEPYHFWNHIRAHNELAQIYKRLGKYELAKREFERIIQTNPGQFSAYLELEQIYERQRGGKETSEKELNIQEQLEGILRHDLSKISEFSKVNNVKLILLTYPSINNYIRITVKEIADIFSIPVVDNFSLFAERLSKGETGIYFIPPYGHCNAVGYKIMAEEIYKTLINEGIVK